MMVRKDLVIDFKKQISLCKIPNRIDHTNKQGANDLVFDFYPHFSNKL